MTLLIMPGSGGRRGELPDSCRWLSFVLRDVDGAWSVALGELLDSD